MTRFIYDDIYRVYFYNPLTNKPSKIKFLMWPRGPQFADPWYAQREQRHYDVTMTTRLTLRSAKFVLCLPKSILWYDTSSGIMFGTLPPTCSWAPLYWMLLTKYTWLSVVIKQYISILLILQEKKTISYTM